MDIYTTIGIQGCSLSLDTTSITAKPNILQIFLHNFYRKHKSLGEVSQTKREISLNFCGLLRKAAKVQRWFYYVLDSAIRLFFLLSLAFEIQITILQCNIVLFSKLDQIVLLTAVTKIKHKSWEKSQFDLLCGEPPLYLMPFLWKLGTTSFVTCQKVAARLDKRTCGASFFLLPSSDNALFYETELH